MGVCDEEDKTQCPQSSLGDGTSATVNVYVACGLNFVVVAIALGVIIATKVLGRGQYAGILERRGSLKHSLINGDGNDDSESEDQASLYSTVTDDAL